MLESIEKDSYRVRARNRLLGSVVFFLLIFFFLPWVFPEERSACMVPGVIDVSGGMIVVLQKLSNVENLDSDTLAMLDEHDFDTHTDEIFFKKKVLKCVWSGPFDSYQEALYVTQKYRLITGLDARILNYETYQ